MDSCESMNDGVGIEIASLPPSLKLRSDGSLAMTVVGESDSVGKKISPFGRNDRRGGEMTGGWEDVIFLFIFLVW